MTKPKIAIIVNQEGVPVEFLSEIDVEILCIDDYCPQDRVYRYSESAVTVHPKIVDQRITGMPVGHCEDGKLEAAVAEIGK